MKVTEVFKKHNLHIQETDFSCGPSSILNILHHKGRFDFNEGELSKICNVQAGTGCTRDELLVGIQAAGLNIIEKKTNGEISDIEGHVDKGHTVIVNYYHLYSEIGHYAVVVEYDHRAFYLADSSFGFLRIRKEKFYKYWHDTDKNTMRWFLAIE